MTNRVVEIRQQNLRTTVGEFTWKDGPTNPTRQERIDYFMGCNRVRHIRLEKLLGVDNWNDLVGMLAPCDLLDDDAEEKDFWWLGLPLAGITTAGSPIPGILGACRESHKVASKYYEPAFETGAAFA